MCFHVQENLSKMCSALKGKNLLLNELTPIDKGGKNENVGVTVPGGVPIHLKSWEIVHILTLLHSEQPKLHR